MMRLVLTLIVSLSVVGVSFAEPPCHMSEIFKCLDIVFNYANSLPRRSLVETPEQVDDICGAMTEAITCWDEYKGRCMTPIQTELEALITEGARDLKKEFCTSGSDIRERFLKHAKCYNEVMGSEDINNKIQYLMAILEMFESVPNNKKITFVCCGYGKLSNELTKAVDDTCGADALSTAGDLISKGVAQLPSVICEGYEKTKPECKESLPPDGTRPTGAIEQNAIYQWVRTSLKNYVD